MAWSCMDCSHFTEVFTDSALSYIHMATVLLVSLHRVPMHGDPPPPPVNTFVYIRGSEGMLPPRKF